MSSSRKSPTTLLPAAVALGVAMILTATPARAGEDKVTICHIPPGNPDNVQIIEVSPSAMQKHIERHGDLLLDEAGEKCDGLDNDCDREVDEDFPDLGAACFDGVGACRRNGVKVCSQDGTGTVCDAIAGSPGVELCTGGVDEDCDGDIDCGDANCAFDSSIHDESSDQFNCKDPFCGDGFVDSGEECDDPSNECCVVCTINVGAECGAGGTECTYSECSAGGSCDSQNTDGYPCTGNGVDACSGPDNCLSGVCQDNGANETVDEPCNGVDEDCFGGDAQPTPDYCDTGLQGICADGTNGCDGGNGVVCVPDYEPNDVPEDCTNGLDDDCDGATDCNDLACSDDPDCTDCEVNCYNSYVTGLEGCADQNGCCEDGCGGALSSATKECAGACGLVIEGFYNLCLGDCIGD